MVQLSKLGGFTQEERRVREIVKASGETVHIFEPTKKDIEKIVDYQEQMEYKRLKELEKTGQKDDGQAHVQIDGVDVVKVFFPLLTDIELDGLSDQEIKNIIENPSTVLIQAQHVVEMIILEVYKMMILSAKSSLKTVDILRVASQDKSEITEDTAMIAAKLAGKDKEIAKVVGKEQELKKATKTKNTKKKSVFDDKPAEKSAMEKALEAKKSFEQLKKQK